jgi:hypothetical protein
MKTVFFLLLLTLISARSGVGQGLDSTYTLFGWVLDCDTHEPLVGANVILVESAVKPRLMIAATNTDGEYRIEGVPVGEWRLEVTYIGYAVGKRHVLIQTDSKSVEHGDVFFLDNQPTIIDDEPDFIAEPPLIEKDPMHIGSKVMQDQIRNLPIK